MRYNSWSGTPFGEYSSDNEYDGSDLEEEEELEKEQVKTKKTKRKYPPVQDGKGLKIKFPNFISFIGQSLSGKSYMLQYILSAAYSQGVFEAGICFCPTAFTGNYDYLPKEAVFAKYDPNILRQYMDKIIKIKESKNNKEFGNFVIFDDIIGSLPHSDETLDEFLTTYRHYNSTVFIASQYVHKIPVLTRSQSNLVYYFAQEQKRANDAMFESWGDIFETANDFKHYMNEICHVKGDKYNCAVFEQNKDVDHGETRWSRVKAPPKPNPEYKIVFKKPKMQLKTQQKRLMD